MKIALILKLTLPPFYNLFSYISKIILNLVNLIQHFIIIKKYYNPK